MRRPATLLPVPAARLAGFAGLAGFGVLEWRGMVASLSAGRALAWVGAGLLAAGLLLAAERRRHRLALPGAVAAGLLGGIAASGIELRLLAPRRWPELGENLARGVEALGAARLPYAGSDPWPAEALELMGATLVLAAAFLAFWPRTGGRGRPVEALALLLALVVSPVVALPGRGSLLLGVVVALLAGCFLFLERLPARPGAGFAVLAGVALVLAVPLGAVADREEPLFDYKSFAEGLGPVEPVRFSWDHGYGPIDWPRDGRELFRVRSEAPFYWKAESLEDFEGDRWVARGGYGSALGPAADLPASYVRFPEWTERVQVTLRRLETRSVVGPGTVLSLGEVSPNLEAEWAGSRWLASRLMGRGDSYAVRAHVPQPGPRRLAEATAGISGARAGALTVTLPAVRPAVAGEDDLSLSFPEFALGERPARPLGLGRTGYLRTWRLARRLRRGVDRPWEYVLRVGAFLRSGAFRYTEGPPSPAPGVPPLEAFLHDDRAGYCQQFSGAMALLLRMGGVPARVAAGFTPGGFRRARGEWIVRDIDAHSWVEVWLDGIGWVAVDPTPGATPARSQTAAIAVPADEEEATGTGSPGSEARAPTPRDSGPASEAAPSAGADAPARGRTLWPAGLGLLVLAVLAAAAVRKRRRRLAGERHGDLHLAELERALRRSGRGIEAGTTLAGLERGLGRSAYLRALRAIRYGRRADPPSRAERAAFRRQLARVLGRGGRVRALWALPPRPGGLPFGAPRGRTRPRRAAGPR